MVIMMISKCEAPTDEQYINALSKHLKTDSNDESIHVLATLVHCTKVLSGSVDGVKKDAATDLRSAMDTKTKKHASLVEDFQQAIKDGRASEMVMPFMASEEPEQPEVDVAEDIVEDDVEELIVEDDVVVADTNPVGITEEMVRAIVNDATASLMKNIRREIGKISTAPVVAKATPTKAPVAKATPTKANQPPVDVPVGLTVRRKKPYTPSGWKDATNYSVAVVYDQVDNGQLVAIVKGLTAEDATASGRNSIRRHLIRAFDASNGNKTLTKITQDRETWVDVAASHGITDTMCDLFITNPNKYVQQSRRTGATRRTKLGITDTSTFVDVVSANMGSTHVIPSVDTSTPDLFAASPASPVIATVGISPADIKALMSDSGMSYVDAKAFLSA